MLTSKVTRQSNIPHEEGEWFRFRMLSGRQLEEASDRITAKYMATVRAIGTESLQALAKDATEATEPEVPRDPVASYDVETLLKYGVVAWSYQDKLSPQMLSDLDDVTRVWAAREILDLTLPKPEDSGNGSGRSTGT
jgi:hypothetical protein